MTAYDLLFLGLHKLIFTVTLLFYYLYSFPDEATIDSNDMEKNRSLSGNFDLSSILQ